MKSFFPLFIICASAIDCGDIQNALSERHLFFITGPSPPTEFGDGDVFYVACEGGYWALSIPRLECYSGFWSKLPDCNRMNPES